MEQRFQMQTIRKTKRVQDQAWFAERTASREQHAFSTKPQARAYLENCTGGLTSHATQLAKTIPALQHYELALTGGTVA